MYFYHRVDIKYDFCNLCPVRQLDWTDEVWETAILFWNYCSNNAARNYQLLVLGIVPEQHLAGVESLCCGNQIYYCQDAD